MNDTVTFFSCSSEVHTSEILFEESLGQPVTGTQEHMLKMIKLLSADGAEAMQAAFCVLHPKSQCATEIPKLPALKMVLLDKAHASRRLTQRTVCTDPDMNNIMKNVV